MSNLNKIDVPIAVEHKTKLDLSCSHVTTMNFMSMQPVYYRHCIKKEHINLSLKSVVRPMPVEVPFYGTIRQNNRAFFVPYRLVFPQWDKFYNDTIGSNYANSSLVDSPPILPFSVLLDVFTDTSLIDPFVTSIGVPDSSEDFVYNNTGYKLTIRGRHLLPSIQNCPAF